MSKKDAHLHSWFPVYGDSWLFGSTRIELSPDERSVWMDFLALASKDGGFIRANEITPYLDKQLAGLLNIEMELLERTRAKCVDLGKLKITGEKTLYVVNWEKYALSRTTRWRRTQELTTSTKETKLRPEIKK